MDDCSKWEIKIIDKAQLVINQEEEQRVQDFASLIEEVGDGCCSQDIAREVEKRLQWNYRYADAARIPAKISVSELKKSGSAGKTALRKPDFLEGGKKMTAALKGTLLHLAMQHMELDRVSSLEDIRSQIAKLVEFDFMTEDEAAEVNPYKILKFFRSEVGRRMLEAGNVRREVPFFIELDAVAVYPELAKEVYGSETIVLQGVIDCFLKRTASLYFWITRLILSRTRILLQITTGFR